MESFPEVPAHAKHPRSAARRHWGNMESPPVVIQTLLPHRDLRKVSRGPGGHTRQVLAELGGTR